MERAYVVYILASPQRTVLYVGVTNNIQRRIWEHQQKFIDGFTKKYNCIHLVYVETTDDVRSAIEREKQLKHWSRKKKEWLIRQTNPTMEDVSKKI